MFSNSREKTFFWFTFALGASWALYRLMFSNGYILDDEPTHFIKSQSAWVNPYFFFDGWTRAGRNLIHAPIAPLGITTTRIFTLALAALAVWLTAKVARHMNLKSLWAIPLLMFFQSWFPDLSYSILTQTPFLLVWILGVFLAQRERLYLASMCFSYLSLIRHEGILLTGLWGLWISFQKGGILHCLMHRAIPKGEITRDLVLAFYTILPILIYNVANYCFNGVIPFTVYFEDNPTDYYGSGPIYHYAVLLLPALGIFSLALAVYGMFFIGKERSKWSLILFTYVSYFAVHSYIFWAGKFASGGYFHFLMPMAPLFALLGVKAIDNILSKYPNRGLITTTAILALITIQGFHMIQQQGMHQWDNIMKRGASYQWTFFNPPIQPEQRGLNLRKAIDYVKDIRNENHVSGNHTHVDLSFGNLQTKEAIDLDWGDIQHFKKGTYFIWDQRLSELRTNHDFDIFTQSPDWKLLKTWDNPDYKGTPEERKKQYTTMVFQKIR